MKTNLSILLFWISFAILSAVSLRAFSGEVYDAEVTGILVADGGIIGIKTEGGTFKKAQPGCATGTYHWALRNDWGRSNYTFSLALAAKASGQKVRIVGDGKCSVSSNKETIRMLMLVDGPK